MSTFALVHGGGGSAWDWHLVEPELRDRGHETVAVDLPQRQMLKNRHRATAGVEDRHVERRISARFPFHPYGTTGDGGGQRPENTYPPD